MGIMGLWDSIDVFGKILMLTKLHHSQNGFYKVRWNYYKLQQLSLLITTMDSCYKFRQLFYYKDNTVYCYLRRYYKVRRLLQIVTVRAARYRKL